MRKIIPTECSSTFGALFSNDKRRSPKAPQLLGELVINEAFLEALIQRFENSEEDSIKLTLGAWRKDAKGTGKIYLTVKAQIPPCTDRCEDDADLQLSGQMLLREL